MASKNVEVEMVQSKRCNTREEMPRYEGNLYLSLYKVREREKEYFIAKIRNLVKYIMTVAGGSL